MLSPVVTTGEDRMHPGPRRRTIAAWALLALLLLQGLGGTAGGLSLSLRPNGSIMRMPVSYLEGSPFADYLVPGLVLLVVLGIAPLVAIVALWLRRAWGWYLAFAIGCGLVIFEIVEVRFIPFSWLQPVFGVVGALIALICLLPSVRRYAGVRLGQSSRA